MRYKKGSIVEVLSKNELPSGSWRCAEIIYGNGHNYTVRYNLDSGNTSEAVVERVSRKSIRPCPPPVELLEDWVPGDILEVYHNFSWKMGIVSKLLGRNYFLVRLIGSSHEFKISKLYLRARQCWHGNKWIMIRKSFHKSEDGSKYNQMVSPQAKKKDRRMNLFAKDELAARSNNFEESYIVPSRTLKRGLPNGNSQVEAPVKFRAIEKEDRHHRFLAENQTPLPVKVDTIASLRVMKGEKHIHASINHRTAHLNEVDEGEKSSGVLGFQHAIRLEPNDADNTTSSVASCSVTSNDSLKLDCNFLRCPVEGTDGNSSDAESVFHWGLEEGKFYLPTQEELAAEIHRLELHAYRCTMEALHALGPLSWEQETLVTDLRLVLHISNDEHLMELRSLISTTTSMPLS